MVIKASIFHNTSNHTPTLGNYTQAFISSAQLNATSQAVLLHVHFHVCSYMLVYSFFSPVCACTCFFAIAAYQHLYF